MISYIKKLRPFFFAGLLFSSSIIFQTIAQGSSEESFTVIENSGQFDKSQSVPLLDFIEGAKKSLDIEIYEAREPLVQEALINALNRGVIVRIVGEPDPVGNSCDVFSKQNKSDNADCELSQNFTKNFYSAIERNKTRFPEVKESMIRYFNKKLCWDPQGLKAATCYQHGKMLIRDENSLLLSTGNFNDSSLCLGDKRTSNSCNRDYSVLIKSSIKAKSLAQIFEMDLKSGATCDLPPKSPRPNGELKKYTEALCDEQEADVDPASYRNNIKNILSNSHQADFLTVSPISQATLLDFIAKAKKSIRIETQYLRDPEWHKALKEALGRGVKVQMTLSSLCHFNKHAGVGSISYSDYYGDNGYFKKYLNPLSQGKASIHIFNMGVPNNSSGRKEGYLHSKVIIIDESEVWIGSTNGSYGSTNINREYGIIIKDPTQAKQMMKMLDFDFKAGMDLDTHVPPPDASGKQANLIEGSCKIKAQSSASSAKTKNEESEDL